MLIHFTFYSFLYLLLSIFMLHSALILLSYSRKRNSSNLWLGLAFLSISIASGIGFLLQTKLIQLFPHLFRTANIFTLAFMPLSYLYIRCTIQKQNATYKDMIHLIPALFYIIDFMPFFVLPASEKLAAIERSCVDMQTLLQFNESWLFPGEFHLFFRTIVFCFYWMLQLHWILKINKIHNPAFFHENKKWLQWIKTYSFFQIFFFFPFFIQKFIDPHGDLYITGEFIGLFSLILTSLALIAFPEIYFGIKGLILIDDQSSLNTNQLHPKIDDGIEIHERSGKYLDSLQLQILENKLEIHMAENLPYLKGGYSIHDLANELNTPVYHISGFLNSIKKISFNEYINQYRIRFCVENLNNNHWGNLNIEGIAQNCGFNNRNSFTAAFKKLMNETPSEYLKTRKSAENVANF